MVGADVQSYCLDVLNRQRDMEEMNGTTIVLIPNVNSPHNMG